MDNRIDAVLRECRRSGRKALIAYLTGGYPPLSEEGAVVRALERGGVDILELGVPFSDPIADGPTIQQASQRALAGGVTLKKILAFVGRLRGRSSLPVVLMGYTNSFLAYGWERFARDARRAGVSGLIVADMILEESRAVEAVLRRAGIHLIQLVAPTTPRARQRELARRTRGFLYAVSVTGVTGARKSTAPAAKDWLASLRRMSPAPVCVGFGISDPSHIRALRSSVDGFIVGSALIDTIQKSQPRRRASQAERFVRRLSKECRHGGR